MYCLSKEIVLKNNIDGRAANNFVYSVVSMSSNIKIVKGNKQINGKSILGVLAIELKSGDIIQISIDKNNSDELNKIVKLINS